MKYSSVFSTVKNVELQRILSSKNPEKFIDTHCGIGWNFYSSENIPQEGSLRISGYYAQIVVGLDISKKYLLRAKANTSDFANAHLVRADADSPPFRDEFVKGSFVNIDPSNIREMISLKTLKYYCSLASQVTLTLPKIEWGPWSRENKAKAYAKKGFYAKHDNDFLSSLKSEVQKIGKKVIRIRGETQDHFRVSIEVN